MPQRQSGVHAGPATPVSRRQAGAPRGDLAAIYAVERVSAETPELAEAAPRRTRGQGVPEPVELAEAPEPVEAAVAADPGARVDPIGPTEPTPSPADPSAAAHDPRLVGVWSTQVVMNGPAGSIATEMRMRFRADGVMVDLGSRALGSVGGGSFDAGGADGGEQADWRTEGDVLWVSYAGSPWTPFARFEISGDRLLLEFPHDGSRQLWSRVPGG